MKPIYLLIVFILLACFANSQDYYSNYKYKKVVSIGISIEPKVSLHTKLITDIAHYYETEKNWIDSGNTRNFRDTFHAADNKLRIAYFKAKHDTTDAFNRLVNNVCVFLSLAFNRAGGGNEINYNDTLFLFKNVNIFNVKEQNIFKKDSLNYLISIKNFRSIQQASYYNIQFDLFIKSAEDKTSQVIKMNIPFTDQQKEYSMFFSCDKPFECLIANLTEQTAKAISERLQKDGFRK
jgi:hypothetical protein